MWIVEKSTCGLLKNQLKMAVQITKSEKAMLCDKLVDENTDSCEYQILAGTVLNMQCCICNKIATKMHIDCKERV